MAIIRKFSDILVYESLITKGAEADVFFGKFLDIPVVIKHRTPKIYRHPEIDKRLRLLRTRQEARTVLLASTVKLNVPKLIGCDLSQSLLILERIAGDNVGMHISQSDSLQQDLHILFVEIGKQVAFLHNLGIIHGDLTPFNILYKDQPFIIDFGLSFIDKDNYEKMATDILTFEAILDVICSEKSDYYFENFMNGYLNNIQSDKDKISVQIEKIAVRGRYISKEKRKKFYH